MASNLRKLLLAYARLGVRDWNSQPRNIKNFKERKLGVHIASNENIAERAVVSPFVANSSGSDSLKLIPMPQKQKSVYAAFFAPWLSRQGSKDQQNLAFDLVVLTQQGPTMAFRFEPASTYPNSTHGYDHVQLNESLGQRQVSLDYAITNLPTTYPAFPIPSKEPVTRFLSMVVSIHGFPCGTNSVIQTALNGRSPLIRSFRKLTSEMLTR